MIKLDQNTIKDLIFTPNTPVTINIALQDSIFKNSILDENILINTLQGTTINSHIFDIANQKTDFTENEGINLNPMHLSIFPSTVYFLLKNRIEISTLKPSGGNESVSVFVCTISLKLVDNKSDEYHLALLYLASLSINLDTQVILSSAVYKEISSFNELLSINLIDQLSFEKANIDLHTYVDEKTVLSLSKQSRMKDDLRSVLNYKELNHIKGIDPNTGSVQLILINQQIKHHIFKIIRPLMPFYFMRIKNYGFNLLSRSGELNINLLTDFDSLNKPLVLSTINYLMNYGILITNLNELGFSFDNNFDDIRNENDSHELNSITKQIISSIYFCNDTEVINNYNHILFRLLGTDQNVALQEIDDLILNSKDHEISKILMRIVEI